MEKKPKGKNNTKIVIPEFPDVTKGSNLRKSRFVFIERARGFELQSTVENMKNQGTNGKKELFNRHDF